MIYQNLCVDGFLSSVVYQIAYYLIVRGFLDTPTSVSLPCLYCPVFLATSLPQICKLFTFQSVIKYLLYANSPKSPRIRDGVLMTSTVQVKRLRLTQQRHFLYMSGINLVGFPNDLSA